MKEKLEPKNCLKRLRMIAIELRLKLCLRIKVTRTCWAAKCHLYPPKEEAECPGGYLRPERMCKRKT